LLAAAAPWGTFRILGTRDYASCSLCLGLAAAGSVALARNRHSRRSLFALTLIVYGLVVAAFCEVFHIRDFLQGGEWKRMNTIFKFYMPVWFFFSIGASYCIAQLVRHPVCEYRGPAFLLSRVKGIVWWAAVLLLLAAASVFTVMGPRARTIGDDNYGRVGLTPHTGLLGTLLPRLLSNPTLNGLAFMKLTHPREYDSILWLNQRVGGQPVIAEASLEDYRYEYARISSNTGFPSVLGWWSHVDQRGYAFRDVRRNDLNKFYKSTDPRELQGIIDKYGISLVYIGPTERRMQTPEQIAKFDAMPDLFTPVFKNGDVAIYQTRYFVKEGGQAVPAGPPGVPAPPAIPTPIPRANLLGGAQGDAAGEYNEPRGIAVDTEGNVYIADFRNYRIQKFDPKGVFVAAWGEEGDYPGQFKDPCDVDVDAKGKVYVADTFNSRVQVFTPEGRYLLHFEGGFFAPRGLAVDSYGRIWVADTGNGVVKVYSPDGKLWKLIGRRGSGKGGGRVECRRVLRTVPGGGRSGGYLPDGPAGAPGIALFP
ncbi:MAG: DUF2298 domain-containing protein, partial [Candidatus Aureabacteria bacterium]|nr:DUF2298 domain-containing protein [Candidatus Auribacterota bacterium]